MSLVISTIVEVVDIEVSEIDDDRIYVFVSSNIEHVNPVFGFSLSQYDDLLFKAGASGTSDLMYEKLAIVLANDNKKVDRLQTLNGLKIEYTTVKINRKTVRLNW